MFGSRERATSFPNRSEALRVDPVISMMAIGFYAGWDRLAAVGDCVVALFGFLLCASCIFSLFWLGVRAMSTGRYNPVKHKRGRRTR